MAARKTQYFVQKIKKTLLKPLSDLITFLFELQFFLSFQYVKTQSFRIWIHSLSASNSSYYSRYHDSCKTCVFWRSNLVHFGGSFFWKEYRYSICFANYRRDRYVDGRENTPRPRSFHHRLAETSTKKIIKSGTQKSLKSWKETNISNE